MCEKQHLYGLTTGCTGPELTKAAACFPANVTFDPEALSVCLNNWMGSNQGEGRQRAKDCSFNYKPFLSDQVQSCSHDGGLTVLSEKPL